MPRNDDITGRILDRWRAAAVVTALVALSLCAFVLAGCVSARAQSAAQPPASATATVAADAATTSPAPAAAAKPAMTQAQVAAALHLSPGVITRVVDGDTVHVRLDDGRTEKVRLIGIDTPENTKEIEAGGKEAAAHAQAMLGGRRVWLETDAELRDRYGRLLAYVWLAQPTALDAAGRASEADLRASQANARLLIDGFAQIYTFPPNVRYVDLFTTFQQESRNAQRALWSGFVFDGQPGSDGGSAAAPAPAPAAPVAGTGAPGSGGSSAYVGNSNTHKFHKAGCASITQMNPSHQVPFATRAAAVSAGYVPCGNCRP